MAFGQDFLKAFFGNDYVKDYRHASKIFRSGGYENAPRFKFLFHVYFNLNTSQIPRLRNIFSSPDQSTIGLLVKTVDLPKYKVSVDTMNQYNRKRLVQSKIEYQPVTVKLHDDGGDLIRTMWYNYFAYYYKDPSQPYRGQATTNGTLGVSGNQTNGFDYNSRDIYAPDRLANDWGYIGESYSDGTTNGKPPFFKDISIYGFNQHKFVEYVLINPMITDWSHDNYDYDSGDGVMENTMTINFETVKYYTGAIGGVRPDTNVQGFGDPNYYDQETSPLSRPGGTRSVIGRGGILDTGVGIIQDVQAGSVAGVVGAVQKAGRIYETTKTSKPSIKEEVLGCAKTVLRGQQTGVLGSGVVGSVSSPVVTNRSGLLQAPQFPFPPSKPGAVPCIPDPAVAGRQRSGG
jgi:hypothetical protein